MVEFRFWFVQNLISFFHSNIVNLQKMYIYFVEFQWIQRLIKFPIVDPGLSPSLIKFWKQSGLGPFTRTWIVVPPLLYVHTYSRTHTFLSLWPNLNLTTSWLDCRRYKSVLMISHVGVTLSHSLHVRIRLTPWSAILYLLIYTSNRARNKRSHCCDCASGLPSLRQRASFLLIPQF